MNTFKYVGSRFLPSAFLVLTAGLYSTVTQAETVSFLPPVSSDSGNLTIAYSGRKRPSYPNIHTGKKPVKADSAHVGKTPGTATDWQTVERKTRASHRLVPFSKYR